MNDQQNKPVKKRGRPKKSTITVPPPPITTEYELILFYPYKLTDFENNLEQQQIHNNLFEETEQKIFVDNITKNNIEHNIINDISLNTNIINLSENKILQATNQLVKCPFCLDVEHHNEIIIPDKTNICCMYDSCKMKCKPVFLPDKYLNGVFHVIGWFCSINCAMSYNLRLNDDNVNKRMSLLFYLYGIHNEKEVHPAPDILLLKKYGGTYDIDEYRNLTKISYPILSQCPIVYDCASLEFIDNQ